MREIVLKDEKPFTPLLVERDRGDTQLFVKEVTVHGARYILCRNEAETEKDRADRQAIVANLEKRLSGGDKALIGNAGHRRYQRRTGAGRAFEIDAGRLAEEARFDGIFVLRTNTTMTPLNAVLRYRVADVTVEWDDLIRDLDRLQEATIEKDGKRVTTRTHVEGQVAASSRPPAARSRPTGANTPPDPSPPENVVETTGGAGVTP